MSERNSTCSSRRAVGNLERADVGERHAHVLAPGRRRSRRSCASSRTARTPSSRRASRPSTRSGSSCRTATTAARLQKKQRPQAIVNGTTTRSPTFSFLFSRADLDDLAHELVAEDVARAASSGCSRRTGAGRSRRSRSSVILMIASRGLRIVGSGTVRRARRSCRASRVLSSARLTLHRGDLLPTRRPPTPVYIHDRTNSGRRALGVGGKTRRRQTSSVGTAVAQVNMSQTHIIEPGLPLANCCSRWPSLDGYGSGAPDGSTSTGEGISTASVFRSRDGSNTTRRTSTRWKSTTASTGCPRPHVWRGGRRACRRLHFAVKASRFLTHMKKLKDPEAPLERLFARIRAL